MEQYLRYGRMSYDVAKLMPLGIFFDSDSCRNATFWTFTVNLRLKR